MLDRLRRWPRGGTRRRSCPPRAAAMTATLANVTGGAFLDEQAVPGERALNDSSPLLPALNDRAPPLNARWSTSHNHRVGATTPGSRWAWIAGARPPRPLRRRMTAHHTCHQDRHGGHAMQQG